MLLLGCLVVCLFRLHASVFDVFCVVFGVVRVVAFLFVFVVCVVLLCFGLFGLVWWSVRLCCFVLSWFTLLLCCVVVCLFSLFVVCFVLFCRVVV